MPKHNHGSGSVYRRGKVWWLSYYANGHHVCESSGTRDKSPAKEMLQCRLGSVAEGRYLGLRPDRVTLDELAQDMLNDYRINAKKSLKDAERAVKTVIRLLDGQQKAQSLGSTGISRYVAQRQADG